MKGGRTGKLNFTFKFQEAVNEKTEDILFSELFGILGLFDGDDENEKPKTTIRK